MKSEELTRTKEVDGEWKRGRGKGENRVRKMGDGRSDKNGEDGEID